MPRLAADPLLRTHLPADDQPVTARSSEPALAYFEAASFDEAMASARALYRNAKRCRRCANLLGHRFERLGSHLFRDDDPRMLARAFDAADRDGCTVRLLAACIVLFGRERVRLH
jgi:hypothetical protein